MELRRGTWFLAESSQPIDPALADPIEKHHLHTFRAQTIPDAPVFSEKESSRKPCKSKRLYSFTLIAQAVNNFKCKAKKSIQVTVRVYTGAF